LNKGWFLAQPKGKCLIWNLWSSMIAAAEHQCVLCSFIMCKTRPCSPFLQRAVTPKKPVGSQGRLILGNGDHLLHPFECLLLPYCQDSSGLSSLNSWLLHCAHPCSQCRSALPFSRFPADLLSSVPMLLKALLAMVFCLP
jgi:hypothetical protein